MPRFHIEPSHVGWTLQRRFEGRYVSNRDPAGQEEFAARVKTLEWPSYHAETEGELEDWVDEIASLISDKIGIICPSHTCKLIRALLPPHINRELPPNTPDADIEGLIDVIANTQFPNLNHVLLCSRQLLEFKEEDIPNIASLLGKKLERSTRAIQRRNLINIPWPLIFGAVRSVLPLEYVDVLNNPVFGDLMKRLHVIASRAQRNMRTRKAEEEKAKEERAVPTAQVTTAEADTGALMSEMSV